MNLETRIGEALWNRIRMNWTGERYAEAIADAVRHLSEVIRAKSDLEADGVSLVEQAFGGPSPALKVNPLQSQADKTVQAGTEALLRGIYQTMRDPRLGEKHTDSQADAEAIIGFIDWLLRIVGRSKAKFSMDDCLRTVFDDAFVKSEEYVGLLLAEIPEKHRMDVFVEALRQRTRGNPQNGAYFLAGLLRTFPDDRLSEAIAQVSGELRTATGTEAIIPLLQVIPEEYWPRLDDIARLRIENMLIQSMSEGEYSSADGQCTGGAFGTWARDFLPHFTAKEFAFRTLIIGLVSERPAKRTYVLHYFTQSLPLLKKRADPWAVHRLLQGLREGKREVFDCLTLLASHPFADESDWIEPFTESMAAFPSSRQTFATE